MAKVNGYVRHNAGKPELSMVLEASEALRGAAEVMSHGKEKYARSSWRKGYLVTETVDSLLRHLTAYINPDESDLDDGEKGSGLPHVDHVLVNAIFLATMARRPDMDDRIEAPKSAPKSKQPRTRKKK